MTRRLLSGLLITGLAFVFIARADDPTQDKSDKVDPKAAADTAAGQQERLARQFTEFENALLRLKQRLQESPRQEDKQKAAILDKAIREANQHGIDTKFAKLRQLVQESKTFDDLTKLQSAIDYNHQLMEDIKFILQILLTDNRDEELRRERERLEKMLKWLLQIRRDQVAVRAQTDRNLNKDRLGKEQNRVTRDADALAKGQEKPADTQDNRVAKADIKAEGKNKGKQGEGKEDTKDPKVGDRAQDGKQGEPKDGKQADAKDNKGEAKSGEGKDGDKAAAKSGEGKDNKGGAKSGEGKDSKQANAKSGESKDGKQGEAKSGDPKKGEAKSAQAKDGKPGDPKAEGKPTDSKAGDSKSASKGKGDGKGQGKPGEGKDGQSGQQSAQSKSGQSGQSGQGGQGKGDQQQAQNQPQQKPKEDQGSTAPVHKKVAEAVERMQEAEKKIKIPDNENATKDQTDASQKLDEARKKLEDLLRQLREEEIERLLAALQMRCERMLAMQIEVRDGTVKVFKDVEARDSRKPDRADQQAANKLSDKEDEIVREANKAIQILTAEGSSVAFPEVFTDVRDEMVKVARRLRATDVSSFTQRMENDIIAQLKEMIEALKKARQDNQNRKPPPPSQGGGGQNNQKLIELLQELKMIRSLQIRVNKRTEDYAREYQGEQAPAASTARSPEEREKMEIIQKELRGLSDRQKKIADITDNLRKSLQQQ